MTGFYQENELMLFIPIHVVSRVMWHNILAPISAEDFKSSFQRSCYQNIIIMNAHNDQGIKLYYGFCKQSFSVTINSCKIRIQNWVPTEYRSMYIARTIHNLINTVSMLALCSLLRKLLCQFTTLIRVFHKNLKLYLFGFQTEFELQLWAWDLSQNYSY